MSETDSEPQIEPVPLPSDDEVDLGMPKPEEAQLVVDAMSRAAGGQEGLTPLQRVLARAVVEAMSGHPVTVGPGRAVGPQELAEGFRFRNEIHRVRIFHDLVLCALVRRPLPPEVEQQLTRYAAALSIDDPILTVVRRLSRGQLGLAMVDFDRNGYTRDWDAEQARALHTSHELAAAWELAVDDPALAARWRALADLPVGTLGRAVIDLYRARGFHVPGSPGSAPPLLAQHDWVHVLADYGTTVENELETFAFVGRADDDPKGFSLLAMVVGLFETGYLAQAAGLFESDPGHLAEDGMAVRVADAMRRGARCHDDGEVRKDFLAVDWFAYADRPVDEVRAAFSVPPKSTAAIVAGSLGPFEPGGISEYQLAAGKELAEAEGRPYEAFGADPAGADPA